VSFWVHRKASKPLMRIQSIVFHQAVTKNNYTVIRTLLDDEKLEE
jgi:hypothetical protein